MPLSQSTSFNLSNDKCLVKEYQKRTVSKDNNNNTLSEIGGGSDRNSSNFRLDADQERFTNSIHNKLNLNMVSNRSLDGYNNPSSTEYFSVPEEEEGGGDKGDVNLRRRSSIGMNSNSCSKVTSLTSLIDFDEYNPNANPEALSLRNTRGTSSKIPSLDLVQDTMITDSGDDLNNDNNGSVNGRGDSSLFAVLVDVIEVMTDIIWFWTKCVYDYFYPNRLKRYSINKRMNEANTYKEWSDLALKLDIIEGNDAWRKTLASDLYDYKTIDNRMEELRNARRNKDLGFLMHLIRSGLFRNLGNMSNHKLYTRCHLGTKKLIEKYTQEVNHQLEYIFEQAGSTELSLQEAVCFFKETRQAFGRSALLLSGGGPLGSYHQGVLKVMYENEILPRVICGSSAGAILASLICTKTEDELWDLLSTNEPKCVIKAMNEDDEYHLSRKFYRFIKTGILCDEVNLRDSLRLELGEMTFQESYNKTGRILNVSLTSTNKHEPPRLLNYLNAPHVLVWSAVVASCALPCLFSPHQLLAKDNFGRVKGWGLTGQDWADGSMQIDLPMMKLSEAFNVNNFIISQVNPFAAIFIHPYSPLSKVISKFPRLTSALKFEFQHRIGQLADITGSELIAFIRDVVRQPIYGDVTIIPAIRGCDYLNILYDPTPDMMKASFQISQRATWEKIASIKIDCDIELKLDQLYLDIRRKCIAEA